ncbi:hypothetical protein SEA_MCKLOVIN_2 [Gordonia phage Mcklovin]|uniref:HNH nuclease domain-containing protein n=1 Tax=Gordonia phage Mcklovin TaxID=2652881 RepID=A0A5P8DCZ1_9CAUD|nr:HNH endonuclease [Gordonia phage Mcklovin]QFP96863.1 hypothetical protein SEA_MCKLOVIN_2 [Gordonia phage Mcklovin]
MFGDLRLPPRFWDKVAISPTGCWEWTASTNHHGYGHFRADGQMSLAHRVAFTALVGDVPCDRQLDHLCRVRSCVNPDHLQLVSPRANSLRGTGVAARNAAKPRCSRGHPLSGDNVRYRVSGGRRRCRECERIDSRKYRARKRGRGAAFA